MIRSHVSKWNVSEYHKSEDVFRLSPMQEFIDVEVKRQTVHNSFKSFAKNLSEVKNNGG